MLYYTRLTPYTYGQGLLDVSSEQIGKALIKLGVTYSNVVSHIKKCPKFQKRSDGYSVTYSSNIATEKGYYRKNISMLNIIAHFLYLESQGYNKQIALELLSKGLFNVNAFNDTQAF